MKRRTLVGGDALGEGCCFNIGAAKRINGQGGCKEAVELSRGKTDGS